MTGDDFTKEHANAFYGVISHNSLVALFGAVGGFAFLALMMSVMKFWKTMRLGNPFTMDWGRVMQGVKDALTLKYLDGGNGQGCSYPDETPSMARRWFHQLTFWGFMLCFAATSVGTVMHYAFALEAPYDFITLPKVLGTLGGLGLLIGPAGLLSLKFKATTDVKGKTNKGMDVTFLVLLFLTSLSGLVLMFVSKTAYVGPALSIHLGIVMTLFLSMPYGKFVHGFYRLIALIAFAVEKQNHEALVGVKRNEKVDLDDAAKARS
jgi:citrate/tricarballylate utilization protein